MIRISISSSRVSFKKYEQCIKKAVKRTLFFTHTDKASVRVYCISLAQMQILNAQWRSNNAPTNVLSFREDESGDFIQQTTSSLKFLGDIYISPEFVVHHKQSLEHMAVHGTLHLLGFDHVHNADAERMERVEQTILSTLHVDA